MEYTPRRVRALPRLCEGDINMPTCWIIAGPNGAGKTTFALDYLPGIAGCSHFINADLIAAGLSPLAPERELASASRLFLREVESRTARADDFAFETTLAGRGYLRLIERLRRAGWRVELIYLALPDRETSASRVAERFRHGGHDIPRDALERRFPRSLHNLLTLYGERTSCTRCFMNHGEEPLLVFEQQGARRTIVHPDYYQHLQQEAAP